MGDFYCGRRTSTVSSCAFREQGNLPTTLCTILFLRQLDRPRPLPFGQRHFLKPAVRPLKLANLIDLHNKGVCFVRRATEPVPAGDNGFLLRSIDNRPSVRSFSQLRQVCYSRADDDIPLQARKNTVMEKVLNNSRSTQAVQKGPRFSPAHPGAPRRTVPQARPQRVKTRGAPLRYVEGLNDARTTRSGFFNSLSED